MELDAALLEKKAGVRTQNPARTQKKCLRSLDSQEPVASFRFDERRKT